MKGAAILGAILLASVVLSLVVGEVFVAPADLWRGVVLGEGPGAFTVRIVRGPRLLTALGAGALLGLSGAILQRLLRNPLAAPDILGFNSGAGLAVILAVTFGVALPMPLLAAGGGVAAALAMALLAWRPGHPTSVLTLILVGLGIGFTTSAVGSFFVLTLPQSEAAEAQRWLTGSLAARTWSHVGQVFGLGAGLALVLAAQLRALKLLELGPDLAAGLGLSAERARWGLIATAVLLAASAVAVAGPVPFIALMAAPLGIYLTGARTLSGQFTAAAGAGAAVCALADLAARAAVPGVALPVGVMTGLLGAPYLLWRLSREMEKNEL